MKTFKFFLAGAAILIATAGSIAAKVNHAKTVASSVFYFDGTNYHNLVTDLQTTGGTQAQVLAEDGSTTYPLYETTSPSSELFLPVLP